MSNENDSKTDAEYVVHLREASRKHLKVGLTFMLVLSPALWAVSYQVNRVDSCRAASAVALSVGALSMFCGQFTSE